MTSNRRGFVYRRIRPILAGASLILAMVACSPSDQEGTFLGVTVEDVTVEGLGGVLVTEQTQNPANAPTGILANDIIIAVEAPVAGGGTQFHLVATVSQLRQVLAGVEVGQQVLIEVYRPTFDGDGRPVRGPIIDQLPLTLQPVNILGVDTVPTFLGLFVADVGLGVGVLQIAPEAVDTIALSANDIITAINGTGISTLHSFRTALAGVAPGSNLTIKYDRGASLGLTTSLTVSAAANSDLPLEGLTVQELTTALAEARGYDQASGAQITGLLFDTPALTSGLTAGDVVIGLQGSADADELIIASANDLAAAVAGRAGQTVSIRVIRGSTPRKPFTLTLLNAPATSRIAPNIGMAIQPRTADHSAGVLATSIYSGGPAANAGIVENDVITHLGGVAVNSPDEFWNQVKALFADTDVRVEARVVTGTRVQFRSLLLTSDPLPATSQPS